MCVWGARANQRHTRHHRSSSVCEWSLHVCTRMCWYYFADLSTVSLHLPVHTVTQNTHTLSHTQTHTQHSGKYMSSNDTKSTLSLKHTISVLSNEKHTHSLKRWKIGKNVRWQSRQLVVGQIKPPVSRRNRELGNQLQGTLRKTNNKKNKYMHTQTHKYACWYVWLYKERERERERSES